MFLSIRSPGSQSLARANIWRRELPTRLTQWAQVQVQNRVIGRVLASFQQVAAPWPIRLFKKFPILRRIPARLIGLGVRPEHLTTPDVHGMRGLKLSRCFSNLFA
jgi:hypothetical protein